MDIKDIRRFRVRNLIDANFGGVSSRFAEKIGKQPSYIARIFSDNPAHARNIGEVMARDIEQACGLNPGVLDTPLTEAEVSMRGGVTSPTRAGIDPEQGGKKTKIPALIFTVDERGGAVVAVQRLGVQDHPGPGDMIALKVKWLKRNVEYSDLNNLWLLTQEGDGMAPTLLDGDMLLVDNAHTSVDFDGIYAFGINGQLRINRIQRELDGGLRIISDNPHYKDLLVSAENTEQVRVAARVVYAWSGRPV